MTDQTTPTRTVTIIEDDGRTYRWDDVTEERLTALHVALGPVRTIDGTPCPPFTAPTTGDPTALAPIGYAVVEEREGDYAPPSPDRATMLGDVFTPADQPDLTDDQAREHARSVAETIAEHLNQRDRETIVRWHIIALVPVTRP